ncbi:MAG: hypothetical protein HYY14_00825 [Candidatus Omnitrophica bacterium]|nr:hypothetical protein [Candidatus Omnitrophota bacterium]
MPRTNVLRNADLFLCLAVILAAGLVLESPAASETEKETNTSVLKEVGGVQFLVEPDREIEKDPITGVLMPEPLDRYVARKYSTLKEDTETRIKDLESKIADLEKKITSLEDVLRRPLIPQAVQEDSTY